MNSTRTVSPSTVTSRITPRSTSEMTGISGSGISSSAAQTCVGGHHDAPGHRAPHLGHLVPERLELVGVRASLDRLRGVHTKSDSPRELGPQLQRQDPERVRPQLLDRGVEARLVAQPLGPHLRVHPVVDLFAVDLRGEARELGVVTRLQRLDAHLVGFLVEPAARDRVRPVEQVQLDERRAAVLVRLAVERERVGVACRARRRRARRARARGRSRSARSTRTRRPPRASARSPSTPSRASRGSARRQRSTGAAVPARSRASFNRALIE